ncbi:MAG: cupredoxin domain-containing protein [Candidatus Methylomirabilia bacterium]
MKTFSRSLFSGIGLILVLTAPVSGQSDPKAEKRVVATVDADGVQRVTILGGGYFYNPNYIVVKVNVPVELSVTKESGMTPHDFVIKAPEAGIDVSIASLGDKPQVVTFTPTKTGKYPFICSKKFLWINHKNKGMEGMLEVTE